MPGMIEKLLACIDEKAYLLGWVVWGQRTLTPNPSPAGEGNSSVG
jgi:hypothetical protein